MKEEQFDRLFQDSINQLDSIPPQASHWNMEETFQKIQDQMHQSDSKRFPRIFDLAAAAVVLLLTAGSILGHFVYRNAEEPTLEAVAQLLKDEMGKLSHPSLEEKAPSPVETSQYKASRSAQQHSHAVPSTLASYSVAKSQNQMSWMQQKPLFDTENVRSLANTSFKGYNLYRPSGKQRVAVSKMKLLNKTKMGQAIAKTLAAEQNPNSAEETKMTAPKKFSFTVPVGVGVMGDRFSPIVSVKATWRKASPRSSSRYATFATAIQAYPSLRMGESQRMEVQNSVFAEAAVGRENTSGNFFTGFEVGAGLLLQSDDTRFEKGTIKINYTLKIKEKISVTPEVILTDNFSKPLPGIKLTLG